MSGAGKVVGHAVDAADADAVRAWVAASADQLGGIDIFVHNTSGKPARKLEGWINNFNIDLMSLVHGVDAASEALADGGGSIVSIGRTASAEHFASGSGSYSALKSAVTNWTLGQAQVLGAKGIRCNVVSPGPIFVEGGDWDMIKQNLAPFFEASEKSHPAGHLGTPRDVADAVAFLVSERAKHVNGVNLTVDGGFLKRIDF
jgi:3-oxoacyl-[acyl-carrier protein] reductase